MKQGKQVEIITVSKFSQLVKNNNYRVILCLLYTSNGRECLLSPPNKLMY